MGSTQPNGSVSFETSEIPFETSDDALLLLDSVERSLESRHPPQQRLLFVVESRSLLMDRALPGGIVRRAADLVNVDENWTWG